MVDDHIRLWICGYGDKDDDSLGTERTSPPSNHLHKHEVHCQTKATGIDFGPE